MKSCSTPWQLRSQKLSVCQLEKSTLRKGKKKKIAERLGYFGTVFLSVSVDPGFSHRVYKVDSDRSHT